MPADAIAPIDLYWWGVIGSFAVELVGAMKATVDARGAVPDLYKSPFYLLVRLGVAFVAAGSLPVVMHAANEYSALYLGASAPLVFDRLQRGLQT